MPEPDPPVAGANLAEQAAHAAGILAEEGLTRLVLRRQDHDQPLAARTTDLPGVLLSASPGSTLQTMSGQVILHISDHGLTVRCAEGPLRQRLAGAPPAREPKDTAR